MMTGRGRPKKIPTNDRLSDDVVLVKLDQIECIIRKNSQDIEELKNQVAMGKGGIKTIFVIGAIVAAFATTLGFYKGG
jgi:hypothetical protein|tara:strand:- start:1461 stop:1694 length:234 start_codon:yes stop_codon:yes gene_type:complete